MWAPELAVWGGSSENPGGPREGPGLGVGKHRRVDVRALALEHTVLPRPRVHWLVSWITWLDSSTHR